VLYISPLKALAVDVERNLRTPLTALHPHRRAHRRPGPDISVGVQLGRHPTQLPRELITKPPDILITTPGGRRKRC
jgi:ATP-dependent Lhr-like helicase